MQRESASKLEFFERGNNEKFFTPFSSEKLFTNLEGSMNINISVKAKIYNFLQKHNNTNITYYYDFGYPLIRVC